MTIEPDAKMNHLPDFFRHLSRRGDGKKQFQLREKKKQDRKSKRVTGQKFER